MNHDVDNLFTWKNFTQSSPEARQEILANMDLDHCLPDMPWREQVKVFIGAPSEIILRYLPIVHWKAQAKIYDLHTPVKAMPDAAKLLDREAQIAVGLRRRHQCLT